MKVSLKNLTIILSLAIILVFNIYCAKKNQQSLINQASFERWNCLVIVLDAARYSHFGFAGYKRNTTPNIDEIARQGVYFTNAFSQHACTIPSIPSMFAGLYPKYLGTHKHNYMVDQFNRLGFRTAIFSENPAVQPSIHSARNFRYNMKNYPLDDLLTSENNTPHHLRQQLLNQVVNWITQDNEERFFCYLHFLIPHNPYLPPFPFDTQFITQNEDGSVQPTTENLKKIRSKKIKLSPSQREYIIAKYDANLMYGDFLIGNLLKELRKRKILDRTLLAITSDHGEAFDEHNLWLHCHSSYEEMVHIPLVLLFPRSAQLANISLNHLAGLIDLMPTFHKLFGFVNPSKYDGINQLPFIVDHKKPPSRIHYMQSTTQLSVKLGSFKLIRTIRPFGNLLSCPNEELFDLQSDPYETINLVKQDLKMGKFLGSLLDSFGKESVRSLEEELKNYDKKTLERLRSLGYLK
jgi:arylsulfatase